MSCDVSEKRYMKRFEIIEFLKGYSIFTIVVFHYLQTLDIPRPYNLAIYFGGTGVHLFVLLSGLGLYLSYLRRPVTYRTYLKKRLSKVYLPYILIVLLSAAISLLYPIYKNSLYALGGHLFIYKMFDEDIIGSYGYQLWFISMILQFYLVFYAIVYVKERFSNVVFMAICLAVSLGWASLVFLLGKGSYRVWNSFFLQYLWEFGAGMVIASLLHRNVSLNFKVRGIYALTIGIACCMLYAAMAVLLGRLGGLLNDIPALIGYSLLGIWIYQLRNDTITHFFLFTGKVSFSLYLLHILILRIATYLSTSVPLFIILPASFVLCYLLALYYQRMMNQFYQKLGI